MDQRSNRRALGQFLRSRRERISPQQRGFPVTAHRRSKGLRREEVAVLAGLSPTWYAYLEQGRNITPSSEVLDSLARVLGLSEDERRYMHTLAYGHVIRPEPLESEISEDELIKQMVRVAGAGPHPVYAVNRCCDLIAWNDAAEEWYDDWARFPADVRNMLYWMFTVPAARERLPDWEIEAQDIVARWRVDVAQQPEDDAVREQVVDLSRRSPEFAHCWNDHNVQEHRSRPRRILHPELGIRAFRLVYVRPPESTSTGIVLHLPINSRGSENETPLDFVI